MPKENFENLIVELNDLIREGTIPIGALGLSQNSADYVYKEYEELYPENKQENKDKYSDIDEIIMEKQEKQKKWEIELEDLCKEWTVLDNNKMKRVTNKPQFHLIRELIRRLLKENMQE